MVRRICLVTLIVTICSGLAWSVTPAERSALIALYESTNGDSWSNNSGWLGPEGSECSWYGIHCTGDGTIDQIDLSNNNLTGSLPDRIGDLAGLVSLDLSQNALTGSIPSRIGDLTNLVYLSLYDNQLTGFIPAGLGNLAGLQYLDLGFNQIVGNIPAELGNLAQLQNLFLDNNTLYGSIPSSLGNLHQLTLLALNGNRLSGTLPSELAGLTSIEVFYLSGNNLSLGQIPSWLFGLSTLTQLGLGGCHIEGDIPSALTRLTNLTYLNLTGNKLNGSLGSWIGNLTGLDTLLLGDNLLNGPLPAELGNLTNLVWLELYGNQFSGTIPPQLANLALLQELSLYGNRLTGSIPSQLGSLGSLKYLFLDSNRLSGSIPATLGNLHNLIYLDLSYNGLTGTLPAELGQMASLERLHVEANALGGELPAQLMNLTHLAPAAGFYDSGLRLAYNAFTTQSGSLHSFINSHHYNGDFAATQTTPPSGIGGSGISPNSVRLSWNTIPFTSGDGYYEIYQAGSTYSSRRLIGRTDSKSDTLFTISGLSPYQSSSFDVRAVSLPNENNPNTVTSDFVTVSATTPSAGSRQVTVWYQTNLTGSIYRNSASQLIPASYLVFQIPPEAFPTASSTDPIILQINLPVGVRLSTTLARGESDTVSPWPMGWDVVSDLALLEFSVSSKDGRPEVVRDRKDLSAIGMHAVQLFRYTEGENAIRIRINESTSDWVATSGDFIGFAIGIGGGVWPPIPNTNLGSAGVGTQKTTLFYLNLNNFSLDDFDSQIPVTFSAYHQFTAEPDTVAFSPAQANLLTVTQVLDTLPPFSFQAGRAITDLVTIDLDRDGNEDICTISPSTNRLYWLFGEGGGRFGELVWMETDTVPTTVTAGDVTGDGWPDCLVSDQTGNLDIYQWSDLMKSDALNGGILTPSVVLKLAGEPSDSLLEDVNKDGFNDYLYSDKTANDLVVMLGDSVNNFGQTDTYPSGAEPVALTTGDFNGDAAADVAVANHQGDSVTVFFNDGAGKFNSLEITGVGQKPIDIDAADFNRDGMMDLTVAAEGDKSVVFVPAKAGNQFDSAAAQKIFFQNTPSAVLADNFDGLSGPDVLLGFSDFQKLALCTSDDTGHMTFAYSIDTLGDVQVDPFDNITISSDNILSVAGGTGYGGVSSREGVAAISQQPFNVLHFPRSDNISFSVVNLDMNDALLNLELYDDNGTFKKSATDKIQPGTQFARYFQSLLGNDANRSDRWVRAFVSQSDTYGLWLINDGSTLNYLDGTRIPDIRDAALEFVFPVIRTAGGHYTQLVLINPNKETSHVILTRRSANGMQQARTTRVLAGRARQLLDAATLFPGITATDYILVQSDRSTIGIEVFGDNQSLAVLEGMKTWQEHGTLYCPHIAVGNLGADYDSLLTLVNTSDGSASLGVSLFDNDGNQIGSSRTVNLAAMAKQALDVATLFNLSQPTTGYLKIDTRGTWGIVGSITFGDAGGGRFIASLPLQWMGHRSYLLGHIANGTLGAINYFTGMTILNPDDGSRVARISAYDQNGVLQDSKLLTIGPQQRQVFLLGQLMPGLGAIFGGYIKVEGTEDASLIVFQLFGDAGLNFLSAVPAVPISGGM